MKRYKLLRDLPIFDAGDTFELRDGGLFREKDGVCAYTYSTLAEFPNILTDWFEEIKPLIKDDKIRKAVRAWAEANGLKRAEFNCVGSVWTFWTLSGVLDSDSFESEINFLKDIPDGLENYKIYTIEELCGDEE